MTAFQSDDTSGREREDDGPALHVRGRACAKVYTSSHPPQNKISISTEALLVWAYAEEMVHAARPEGIPVELARGVERSRPVLAASRVGARLGAGEGGMKVDFEAPRDAYVVHAAVLALGTVTAALPSLTRKVSTDAAEIARAHARAEIAVETRVLHGDGGEREVDVIRPGRVDAGGFLAFGEETVAVDRAQLVFAQAVRRARPEWFPAPTLRMKRGDVVMHPRARRPWFCRVEPVGDLPHEVARARRLYTLWAEAVAALSGALAGRLQRYAVSAELPHPAPWTLL